MGVFRGLQQGLIPHCQVEDREIIDAQTGVEVQCVEEGCGLRNERTCE